MPRTNAKKLKASLSTLRLLSYARRRRDVELVRQVSKVLRSIDGMTPHYTFSVRPDTEPMGPEYHANISADSIQLCHDDTVAMVALNETLQQTHIDLLIPTSTDM